MELVPNVKPRVFYFDTIKAILIVLVVLGHMINVLYKNQDIECFWVSKLWQFIYLFHMPCFVFISGFFSKRKGSVKKVITTLFLPYLVFNGMFYLMERTLVFPLFPKSAMWYLFALCIWKLIMPFAEKIKHIALISILVAVLYDLISIPDQDNAFSKVIRFFPFFVLGYFATDEQLKKMRSAKMRSIIGGIALASLLLFIGMQVAGVNYVDEMLFAKTGRISFDSEGILTWAVRILSGVMGFAVTIGIVSLVPDKKNWLTPLGQRTMTVFLFHFLPIFQILIKRCPLPDQSWVRFGFVILLTVVMCFAFSRTFVVKAYNFVFEKIGDLMIKTADKGVSNE